MAGVSKDEIEQLAVHVDQVLENHPGVIAGGWVPVAHDVLLGLQAVLKDIRPGRPAPASLAAGSGASSPAPADPPLPGAKAAAVSISS
jgi:hypothetical protein